MRVAITGSHGLIGQALARSLKSDGHQVVPVVRGSAGEGAVHWDLTAGEIDSDSLEGLDGVVHLAGAGIASGRWTDGHKGAVRDSRTRGTALLSEALASLDRPPAVLVSGSAIGYYGDRGDEVLTETSGPGEGFLPEVCLAWEAATGMAETAGIRVVHVRTGIVLSPDGGALGAQLLPFKLGLGGPAGAGHQWLPWISIDDEVAAIRFLLENEVRGPFDLTAPEPATNAEFARTLGRVLRRPAVLPIPRLVTHLPLGIGPLLDNLLFSSARVLPAALLDAGFTFGHTDLEATFRRLLHRPADAHP